ncbi:MAG: hypothetical protein DMG96_30535 [Acidobacteria bacterium]|nr:MAG: hypothetical protein DMG96_30535 [Acidobacteriota bacterium]
MMAFLERIDCLKTLLEVSARQRPHLKESGMDLLQSHLQVDDAAEEPSTADCLQEKVRVRAS